MQLKNKKIVVIGGCGTVGSLMARILKSKGNDVTVSDIRKDTYLKDIFKSEGIKLDLGGHDLSLIKKADAIAIAPSLTNNKKVLNLINKNPKAELIKIEDILKYKVKKPVVGITGTNGKTTTREMLKNILKISGLEVPEHHLNIQGNTEFIPPLQARLPGDVAVVEIGTFGVKNEIKRSAKNSNVTVGVITNISRDHLKNISFQEYVECKKEITEVAKKLVLNADDPIVASFGNDNTVYYGIENLKIKIKHFFEDRDCPFCGKNLKYEEIFLGHLGKYECECGFKRPRPTVKAIDVENKKFILSIDSNEGLVKLEYGGIFNVYNALAAAAAAFILKIDFDKIIEGLNTFKKVPGRMEKIYKKPEIIIDYAHNVAGVKAILQTIKPKGRLIVVNTISSESGIKEDIKIAKILSSADILIPASYSARKASKYTNTAVINVKSTEKKFKKGTLGASKFQVEEAIKKALSYADKNDTILIIGEGGVKYGREIIEKIK